MAWACDSDSEPTTAPRTRVVAGLAADTVQNLNEEELLADVYQDGVRITGTGPLQSASNRWIKLVALGNGKLPIKSKGRTAAGSSPIHEVRIQMVQ